MRMPNTPFSTRLSGSAKETELRLRSIFQWKKKRPPVMLALLIAVMMLSCFGLFSCAPAESNKAEDGVDLPLDNAANAEESESQIGLITWQGEPIVFPDGNMTITPPETWKGKAAYQVNEDYVKFYLLSAVMEMGTEEIGALCTVYYLADEFYSLDHTFVWPGEVIALTAGGTYAYFTPSDAQFTPKTQEEYTALFRQVHDIQFELSDWLLQNSMNEQNPDVPELTTTIRAGRTMVVTEDTVMSSCYSYTYNDPMDIGTYGWFWTGDNCQLTKGDVVLVLEEVGGMSRVVIPYGDIPRLYGFVDSSLLSDDSALIRLSNQAAIVYSTPGYAVPGDAEPVIVLAPCTVQWYEKQGEWVRVQPLGTGEEQYWVESSHLQFEFDKDNVVDAPTGMNFVP